MSDNPVRRLHDFGQSPWLDFLSRGMLNSGELARLIEEDGIAGVTSNPAIFEKAIVASDDYDEAIAELAAAGKGAQEIYEILTVEDVQNAADLLRPMYDQTEGLDGYVSLEVNPHLALDTEGTLDEARRLHGKVDRPNLFIKVPATAEGLPAIEQLISEGINVNVTLLFGLPRYREVADAYITGLERRAAAGAPVRGVASVASFFLSRIDVLIDPLLEEMIAAGGPSAEKARRLRGEVAIACAKIAYEIYGELFGGARFAVLAERGARVQRLLWASTGTKNPDYPDTKYVEPLIGPDTVNTLPLETIEAYRDHGDPASRLEDGLAAAHETLALLGEVGIDLDAVTAQLVEEGIDKFNKPYDKLIATLEEAVSQHGGG